MLTVLLRYFADGLKRLISQLNRVFPLKFRRCDLPLGLVSNSLTLRLFDRDLQLAIAIVDVVLIEIAGCGNILFQHLVELFAQFVYLLLLLLEPHSLASQRSNFVEDEDYLVVVQ